MYTAILVEEVADITNNG